MKALVGPVALLAMLAARAVRADAQRADSPPAKPFVPTVALEQGQYREKLAIDLGDSELSETRSLWVTRVALGLAYPVGRLRPWGSSLRAQSSVGVGLVYQLGEWPLHARQELAFHYPVTSWLSVELGFGTGFQLNLTDTAKSYWEFGLPLGVSIAKLVELVYYPMLDLALGADETPVFGGTRSLGIDTGIAPLNLVLRFRLLSLAF